MIKLAFPKKENRLSSQFENCTHFQIYSIEKSSVVKEELLPAPPLQPDMIPIWLSKMDVSDVIAANIGLEAIKTCTRHKINVFAGVKEKEIKTLVQDYLDGILETNGKICDH